MKPRCVVTFIKNHQVTPVEVGDQETVLELALDNDIDLDHSCGGFGACGTCRVFVDKGVETLPLRVDVELEMAEDRGFAENERLACQISPISGLELRIPNHKD